MPYQADAQRYDRTPQRRCGNSGLQLPAISLGLWHNFSDIDPLDTMRNTLRTAFDHGITHFDLANNYGPPPGSAESNFGQLLREDFTPYRDELIISSKAGYRMWPGPYGDGGSRKYLLASLDQSLRRMGLDYVDIFYHHRPDPDTPLEETMGALAHAVRSGRALYVGISNYPPDLARAAAAMLSDLGTPCLIHQPSYNMFNRRIEEGLLPAVEQCGMGCIVFSPLAQGQLSDRYLDGIPADSRAGRGGGVAKQLTPGRQHCLRQLNALAQERGQSLVAMSLTWVLRHRAITSALIGASSPKQITQALEACNGPALSSEELQRIDAILAEDAAS